MTLCFQSFNYASNVNCCVSKNTRKVPSFVKLSPILHQTEEIHISSFNNGIGIIGGVLVDSTLSFAKKIVNLKAEEHEKGMPFVLRSDFSRKNTIKHINHGLIVETLRRERDFLEKSGVFCIVMPCHVLHSWYDEISDGCSVPFLNMGDSVVKELKEAKLRPIEAGSSLRVGLIATNVDLVGRFYKEKLESEGYEVVVPDKATMDHTVIPAVEALSRNDIKGAQNLFRIALQVLLVRAVNRIIIASDELRELLPPDDPVWTKCIDPIDALARSAVEYTRSNEGEAKENFIYLP